jgi:hypothetical protein
LKDTSIDLIAVIDDEKCGKRFLGHVIISSNLINNIVSIICWTTRCRPGAGKAALKALADT